MPCSAAVVAREAMNAASPCRAIAGPHSIEILVETLPQCLTGSTIGGSGNIGSHDVTVVVVSEARPCEKQRKQVHEEALRSRQRHMEHSLHFGYEAVISALTYIDRANTGRDQGGKSDGWCRVVADFDQPFLRQTDLHEVKVDPNLLGQCKVGIKW